MSTISYLVPQVRNRRHRTLKSLEELVPEEVFLGLSFDALEADGPPRGGLRPENSLFNINDSTFYAYLRKYAKRAGLDDGNSRTGLRS